MAAPTLDATAFDTPTPLATGSATEIPEGAPAWSPDGTTIAFGSARSGTTQIFTMPAAGGTATEVTNEVGGAFDPSWSGDGHTIFYLSTAGSVHLRRIQISGGSASGYESDSLDLDEASCDATLCLAAEDPTGDRGSILAFPVRGGKGQPVIARRHNERQAALLVP
ncbi:MAG: hypothetical protein ABI889_13815 [Gemmatimonadota bacterium]